MTIDEARRLLRSSAPRKAFVLYRPMHGGVRCEPGERGFITRVSGTWVFADFGLGWAQAVDPADLEPLAGEGGTDG